MVTAVKQDDKRGMLIIVGLRNDNFFEIGEFGFIKDLAKILNETTKKAFLDCNHVTRLPCYGGVNTIEFYRRINTKIEFSSQRREILFFLTTSMPAVTSSANQQY